ncbi:MAG: DUF664 domain-containing protein [Holophagaceae bacterium]
MIADLRKLLARELATLRREVDAYPDDASLWAAVPGLPNSGGNLALHLCGNLRHFIGAGLGRTGYVRDRDAEFSTRGRTRAEVVAEIGRAAADVDAALQDLDPARLREPFPLAVGGGHPPTRRFLLHLLSHLAFHLGQLDAHRRAATGDPKGAGALGAADLLDPA